MGVESFFVDSTGWYRYVSGAGAVAPGGGERVAGRVVRIMFRDGDFFVNQSDDLEVFLSIFNDLM